MGYRRGVRVERASHKEPENPKKQSWNLVPCVCAWMRTCIWTLVSACLHKRVCACTCAPCLCVHPCLYISVRVRRALPTHPLVPVAGESWEGKGESKKKVLVCP